MNTDQGQDDVQKQLEDLKLGQATQAATLTGMQATQAAATAGAQAAQAAAIAGVWSTMAAGAVALVGGIFLGIMIGRD